LKENSRNIPNPIWAIIIPKPVWAVGFALEQTLRDATLPVFSFLILKRFRYIVTYLGFFGIFLKFFGQLRQSVPRFVGGCIFEKAVEIYTIDNNMKSRAFLIYRKIFF
jgi:hypothetical protein